MRGLLLLLVLAFSHSVAGAGSESGGLRYTISPVVVGTAWQNDLGLKDGLLYGGKLGIDFGSAIGLEAFYLTSADIDTRLAEIGLRDTAGVLVADGTARVRRMGADLILRWPAYRVAPFAKVGGGIIRFEPETGDRADRVEVRVGGGMDYILNRRLRARTWVELSRLRLDRYALAPGGVTSDAYPLDPEAEDTRDNLSVGFSLDYALGQARFAPQRGGARLQPFSAVELEPFVGRFDFDDPELDVFTVAGARVGGELNPYVGWGAYFWRAMASDFGDTRPLQSYGGEARFGLSSTAGPQPYLVFGVGQLDFLSSFRDRQGASRDDRTALIVGAGVRAGLTSRINLSVSARDYMFSQGRLDRTSGTDDIRHNWLLSGALVFGIGGWGRGPAEPTMPVSPPAPVLPKVVPGVSLPPVAQVTAGAAAHDTLRASPTSESSRGYLSGQNIVIPVPLEGEIYIRYGAPSREMTSSVGLPTVRPDSLRRDSSTIVSPVGIQPDTSHMTRPAAIRDTLPLPGMPDSSKAGADMISRRELDSLLNALRTDLKKIQADTAAPSTQPGRQGADTVTAPVTTAPMAAADTVTATTAPASRADSAAQNLERDSLVAELRTQLEAAREQRRQDSLERVQAVLLQTHLDSATARRAQDSLEAVQAALLQAQLDSATAMRAQDSLGRMQAAALQAQLDSAATQRERDSLLRMQAALQAELDSVRVQREQDSLMRIQETAERARRDSITEARIQREVAEQVATALSTKPSGEGQQISEADLNAMYNALASRIDTVAADRSTRDTERLRDQLQLEVSRQTKSQEEFQRDMEAYMVRYGQLQDQRALPPTVVVTQPALQQPVIERPAENTTIVLRPDTQYVVISDTTRATSDTVAVPILEPVEQKPAGFIDLHPSGYMAFGLEQPRQFVLGGRLNVGRITSKVERLYLVPEFALGLGGGGVSIMAVLNAEYHITEVEAGDVTLRPYARLGFGVLGSGGDLPGRRADGVVNITYGLILDPRKAGWFQSMGAPALFIEHQIIDLFDLNRLALGLQWTP